MVMSTGLNDMPSQEVAMGSKIELRTSSGAVICLNFSEKDQVLPKIVRLVDPDSDHSVVFRSESGVYHELDSDCTQSLHEFQRFNHCPHCNCDDSVSHGSNGNVRQGNERLEKQREKLQRKLRERKESSKDDGTCDGHCHQVIQLPIQGLRQYVHVNTVKMNGEKCKSGSSEEESSQGTKSTKGEKILPEELKIHKAPEIQVLNYTTVKVSWTGQVSNNSHLTGCSFDLQMFTKTKPYHSIYSGSDEEFIVKDLVPGGQYRFRIQAVKDDDRGEFSPEGICHMPSTIPSTPMPPSLASKAKTSLTLKWAAPSDNGSAITNYRLEWNKGEKGGPFTEVYCGQQRQFRLTHKLPPATPCSFRVQAVNGIGASKFSKELRCVTAPSVPSTPTPPQMIRASVNSIQFSWSKPESKGAEITEYLVEMDDNTTGYGFRVVYRGLENTCVVDKLQRNTCYKFRLLAVNSQGKSKWSEVVLFSTHPERPGQPFSPRLEGKVRTAGFTVTWALPSDNGGSEVTALLLEADDGKGGDFREVYRGLECEYIFNDLSPGHQYRLRLAAMNVGGISDWSRMAKIRTLPVVPGPANPPLLSKQHRHQPNVLDLLWDPPNYNGGAPILGYTLEMENTTTKEFREIHHLVDNICTVAGLLPGKTYAFRVKARNEVGVGKPSAVSRVTTAPGPPCTPNAPDMMCRSAAAILVSWEHPEENGSPVIGYTLEWMIEGKFVELYSGPDKTCEVRKGVSPASFYYFRVKALSAAGQSLWSPVSTCQTPPASPCAISSIKVVDQSSSHVRLRWKHPGNNGAPITSYNVEVTGYKNISFDVDTAEISETKEEAQVVQEYNITDLQPNTSYRIRVQAVNRIGCGPFNSVFAITGDVPPPAPHLELVSTSYQSLKLKWTSSNASGGKNGIVVGVTFTLQMLDKNGIFTTIFSGSSTSHKVNKLQERTEYQFRIQASNDAGAGPFSDVVSFMTTSQPPNVVKGLSAESSSTSSVTVTWDPMQSLRNGDTVEYLLQAQCVGKDLDFRQVYQGPNTKFEYDSLPASTEMRFRVCALRLTTATDEAPVPIKGSFSPIASVKTFSPRKISETVADSKSLEPKEKEPFKITLTDKQWALVFFSAFALLVFMVVLLLPCLFSVTD